MTAIADYDVNDGRAAPAGLFSAEPAFAAAGLLLALMMAPTAFAMLVDPRTLLDVNIWEKPLKFQLSLAVYLLTLAFYARFLPEVVMRRRWYRVFSTVVLACVAAEMLWIVGAAANGVASHFNKSVPALEQVYFLMGLLAAILTSATLVYGVLIGRSRHPALAPAVRASLAIGLVATFALTLVTAFTMAAGDGHLVGGNLSDAEGAPLMGWARDGGDLRVAHFFATHAMHFIPAFGLVAARAGDAAGTRAVWAFSAVYAMLVAAVLAQGLAGMPFLPGLI